MDKEQDQGHERTKSTCQDPPDHKEPEDADGNPTDDFGNLFHMFPIPDSLNVPTVLAESKGELRSRERNANWQQVFQENYIRGVP
jgi:hypothetical protein